MTIDNYSKEVPRRLFIKSSLVAAVALSVSCRPSRHVVKEYDMPQGMKFLFQGDSITDGNRGRNGDLNHIMGHGYAFTIAGRFGVEYAQKLPVSYNRGISGNTINDLSARWQNDTLELKPDLLSVLIGINDAARIVKNGALSAQDIEAFESSYRDLLARAKQLSDKMIIVLCQPFVYPVGRIKQQWPLYKKVVGDLSACVSRIAEDVNAINVDFSKSFDAAFMQAPMNYWIWDGIHPTVAGHEMMAREWLKEVGPKLKLSVKF